MVAAVRAWGEGNYGPGRALWDTLAEQGERAVLDHAASHHKGILIKKALASGHAVLAGKDPVRASFELVFGHPGVSSAIVGTINPQHLAANAAAAAAVIRG